jgi:hypothetical protein
MNTLINQTSFKTNRKMSFVSSVQQYHFHQRRQSIYVYKSINTYKKQMIKKEVNPESAPPTERIRPGFLYQMAKAAEMKRRREDDGRMCRKKRRDGSRGWVFNSTPLSCSFSSLPSWLMGAEYMG